MRSALCLRAQTSCERVGRGRGQRPPGSENHDARSQARQGPSGNTAPWVWGLEAAAAMEGGQEPPPSSPIQPLVTKASFTDCVRREPASPSDSVPVPCVFCKSWDCGVGLRSLSPHPRPCPMHSPSQNSSSSNTGRPGTWAVSARFGSTPVATGLCRVRPPHHLRGKTSAPPRPRPPAAGMSPGACRTGVGILSRRLLS